VLEEARVLGVVLAGGASSRFGTDKSIAGLCGKALLEWVIERARPQVHTLLVNTNNDPGQDIVSQVAAQALPAAIAGHDILSHVERLSDDNPGEGPLAGILAALDRASERGFTHVASFACDTPFFPSDTVVRLSGVLYQTGAGYAVARCGVTVHRIFALWPVSHLQTLHRAFTTGARSMRAIENWLTPAWADFPPAGGPDGDPFFNINAPDDLAIAERWLAGSVP